MKMSLLLLVLRILRKAYKTRHESQVTRQENRANELLALNLSCHANRPVSAQSVTDQLRADPHSPDDKSNS